MTAHVRRSVAVTVAAAVCFVTLVGVPAGARTADQDGTNSLDDGALDGD
jgi:hypothetical protein